MNIRNATYLLFSLCLSSATVLNAATLAVLPGESIQAQIDASSAGDIVAIFGGTYSEDITINKAIRLVEVSGQEVSLLGDVTFDGVTDAPPFEGFTVGSSGKDITVTDTTGLLIRSIDHSAGNYLRIGGSSNNTTIVECTLSGLVAGSGVLELVDSTLIASIFQEGGDSLRITNVTVGGYISQSSGSLHTSNVTVGGRFFTSINAVRTIAFRTTVSGDCDWYGNRSWFGYSAARSFNFSGSNAKVVVVGTTIDRLNSRDLNGMTLTGSNNQFFINNSVVKNVRSYNTDRDNNIEITGSGNSAYIINNYLHKTHDTWYGNQGVHDNIYINDTTEVLIANNIFSNEVHGMVEAPFGVTVSNNHVWNGSYTGVRGGVAATNTTTGSLNFVDGDPYQLGEGSPCINAGTDDPRYNDRDGSRNDIGPSGGAWYDPDGWTTENPVVISFELSKDQILEGDATPLLLQEGLGVSIP
jgi:hypothetical protein